MFDCIIVGAGPSGASAAYHLAKKGHSVLILEKGSLPRIKTCGGGVSPAISQWLDFDFQPIIDNTISQVEFTWQMEDKVEAELNEKVPMWMVKRDQFDNFLLEKAQEQGAKIQDKTEVQNVKLDGKNWEITTNNGNFNSAYLIAADGANSQIAKMLGFKLSKPSLGANLEIMTTVPENKKHTAYFDFGTLKNGYIWTFTKSDGYTINGGFFKGNGNTKELETKLKEYAKNLGLYLNKSQYQEYNLGLWNGNQNLHTKRALLVGEAARLVDPISGEGIRPGIFSGFQAAGAISQALAGYDNALAQYTVVINEELGKNLVLASRLGGLFYQFTKIAYKAGVKRPAFATIMSKVLTGELDYSDITEAAINRLKKSLLPGNN
jgi:geranylgeranyl reductase family protein